MRHGLITMALLASSLPVAAQSALPQSLPELAALLPSLVHSKQMKFGPFSDAMATALQRDPGSAAAAMPALSHDLQDADPEVRIETLAILQGLAMMPNGAALLEPVAAQVAGTIASPNESVSSLSLLTLTNLRQNAPEVMIAPAEHTLTNKASSDRVVMAAAQALMTARPMSDTAQAAVLAVVNDSTRSVRVRGGVLVMSASPFVGPRVIDGVVNAVNTSQDKQLRDAAIIAASKIGSKATVRVSDELTRIANDSTESLSSHQIAHRALTEIAPM